MALRLGCIGLHVLVTVAVAQGPGPGTDPKPGQDEPVAILHEGFESPRPTWRQEDADVTIRLLAHDRSERACHDGQRSEHFRFSSEGPGSAMYYSYALPRIPLVDGLEAVLYVRGTRPGVQVLAQVILPRDIDPDTGQPSFVRVAGTTSEVADRWERLELTDVRTAVERQVRLLRYQTRRPIPLTGAYLDRIVVNLYGGVGEAEIFLDDLRISPVPEAAIAAAPDVAAAVGGEAEGADPGTGPAPAGPVKADIRVDGGHLTRDGADWVPSILHAPGADLNWALPFGFDVLAVPPDADPDRLRTAVRAGALLMPDLGGGDPAAASNAAAAFPLADAVAFWNLGSGLGGSPRQDERTADLERTRAILDSLRGQGAGPARLATAAVAGDLPKYVLPGQGLDLIGVAPGTWGTCNELTDLYEYLRQRRNLTALWNVGVPYWTWIDAALPPVVRWATWGNDRPPAWGLARVQPEQLRVATYLALMSGYRGVGYRADAELTRAGGEALLYELGLLNAEIDLVQPLLARGADPILALAAYPPDPKPLLTFLPNAVGTGRGPTYGMQTPKFPETPPHPSIRAAAISTPDSRGRLVLLADLSPSAQWQPSQMAFNDLKVTVPGVSVASQPLWLSLGGGRWLGREVVPGGVRFTLPEFDVATMVLLTTDIADGERLKREIERVRPRAVDLLLRQARRQYDLVKEINGRLALDGYTARDAADLLALAAKSLESAEQARGRADFEFAWDEARRVARPLRVLMRSHWDLARVRLSEAAGAMRDREHGIPPLPYSVEGQPKLKDPNADARKRLPLLVVPTTASPPLVAFNTLPQHYVWCDWIARGQFGRNLLAGGDLEKARPKELVSAGWTDVAYNEEAARSQVRLIPAALPGDEGRGQVLWFQVAPRGPEGIDKVSAFLDHAAAAVRTPPVLVKATQFLRISVLVKMPRAVPAGLGGLIVRDSLGGEALQFRHNGPLPDWSEVVLFRRVPADGELTVTLGLAGYGEAFFDDVRIERLEQLGGPDDSRADLVRDRQPPRPAPSLPAAPAPASAASCRDTAAPDRTVR